jgi:cytochrome c oxidase assembly protein subunit 15
MRAPEVTPRAFRRLTLCNLVLLAIIVVTGAAVRLTDSGLGCSNWPSCTSTEFVSVDSSHRAIEQVNRLFSGIIVVPIVLLLYAVYRRQPRRRDLVVLAWLMLVLFLGNAVVGGIAVLVDLAWFSVMGHFLLALAAVATALTMHRRAAEPGGPRRITVRPGLVAWVRLLYVLTVWVVVAGTLVTAAGPHGGDEDARRLGWDIRELVRVHSVSVDVLVALAVTVVVLLVRSGAPREVVLTGGAMLAAMVGQGVLGYVQYAADIPPLLVGIHVGGAVCVFGTVHWLLLTLWAPQPVVAPGAPSEAGDQRRDPDPAEVPVGR